MSGTFIAGPYTATYNAKALGQTAQGFFISHEFMKRMVTGDLGADTVQDAIYRGRNQFVEMELIEVSSAGVADLIEPYATVLGTPLTMGVIGTLDAGFSGYTGKAKQVVLTPVSGSSAAYVNGAVTLPLCIIAEGYPIRALLGPDLRQIPIRLRVYPGTDGVFGTEA